MQNILKGRVNRSMHKSIEVAAKTIDKAIEEALATLGASYDEVDVEILQEAGFLKKAKVLVTVKNPVIMTETGVGVQNLSAEIAEEKVEVEKPKAKEEKKVEKKETKVEKKAEKKEVKQETKVEKKEEKVEKKERVVQKAADGTPVKFEKTLAFVTELIELLGVEGASIVGEETDRSYNINITGENSGRIIGKGGEVMNAIQSIVSVIAIANSNGENRRVNINIENYKERRIETLKALAIKKADKVKETGRYIKLEPMNARDRAIIHSALQGIEGIRTYSTGKDPYRCLCIAPPREDRE